MNENELFKTKDFYLACFLKAKDIRLIKTEKDKKLIGAALKNNNFSHL